MKNLKEFKELIIRYETITLEEIKTEWKKRKDLNFGNSSDYIPYETANKLTGFGSSSTCTLCLAVKTDFVRCGDCVYAESYGCVNDSNEKTYNKIVNTRTPKGLLTAFRKRAEHLRNTYKEILNENK